MGKQWNGHSMSLSDVLQALKEVEVTYAIKIRLSVVPRPGSGYKQGCIFLATPYTSDNKKHKGVEAEQHLWPTSAFKSENGLWVYLIHRLCGALDEQQHARAREAQQKEPEALTPLENYIANSF